ncbi:hypothetical protein [Ekhidna sp.]|uniref:hypothetical protein n=1 Tax=Ekhidna sp. TaxID=2608089 RepID=UPI003BAD05BD
MNIELSNEEALVLFELLSRISNADTKLDFVDQAEQRVLWNLEAELEKQLTVPLLTNYKEQLEAARNELRDK